MHRPSTFTFVFVLAMCAHASATAQMIPPLPVPTTEPTTAIDLMTNDGAAAFKAQWRYSDAKIVETQFTLPGPDRNTPGKPVMTYEISPRAGEGDFDDSEWEIIGADTLGQLRGGGKVSFNWYRINLTMPDNANGIDVTGMTAVLHTTVDDYAEIWVNGRLPRAIGAASPNLVQGFNIPNRVTLTQNVKPGETIQIAIFGINGPISAAPTNYIWFRDARIEFHPMPAAAATPEADSPGVK